MPLHRKNRKWVLDGPVCTIHLRSTGATDQQFADLVVNVLRPAREDLIQRLELDLKKAFGSSLKIGNLFINEPSRDILIPIDAENYSVRNSTDLERALTLFVFFLQDKLNEAVRDKFSHVAFHGHWFPGPQLIGLKISPPEKHRSALRHLQQPITTLLLGTLLGSALIPWVQARSNARQLRHEERIKLALFVIDQNRETISQLNALQTTAELFAKDHPHPTKLAEFVKDQKEAREKYDVQYLVFDRQAWSWTWSVLLKAQLASLAKNDEAKQIETEVRKYKANLQKCVQLIDDPWNALFRSAYEEQQWKITAQRTQAVRPELENCHTNLDQIAGTMSRILASDQAEKLELLSLSQANPR
jgi:hypothetical protein